MIFRTLLTSIITLSATLSHAEVTMNAFGPNNAIKVDIAKCDKATNAETYFTNGQNFSLIYINASDGSCVRYKRLEKFCTPHLYYCATDKYKYKSNGVAFFKDCPHPTFTNKTFPLGGSKNEACLPKNKK